MRGGGSTIKPIFHESAIQNKPATPSMHLPVTMLTPFRLEVRTYPGWNPTTHTTTGPIEVEREYWPQSGAGT